MRTILAVSILLAAACGEPGVEPVAELAAGKGEVPIDAADVVPTVFGGRYLLGVESDTTVRDIDTGELTSLTTSFGALASIKQEGDVVSLEVELCSLELPQVKGYQPSFIPGFLDQLAVLQIRGKVSRRGDELQLRTERFPFTMGLALDDPLADALPLSPDSDRLVDEDRDEQAGVTLKIGFFSVFVAVRVGLALQAEFPVTDSGDLLAQVSGRVEDLALDWQIYGDNIPFYDAAASAAEASNASVTVDRNERFTLSRTQQVSCAEWGLR